MAIKPYNQAVAEAIIGCRENAMQSEILYLMKANVLTSYQCIGGGLRRKYLESEEGPRKRGGAMKMSARRPAGAKSEISEMVENKEVATSNGASVAGRKHKYENMAARRGGVALEETARTIEAIINQ